MSENEYVKVPKWYLEELIETRDKLARLVEQAVRLLEEIKNGKV
jgi:hypothetical protein